MRKPKLLATTPPALFPVILGLLGLGLALRRALAFLDLPGDAAEIFLGALLGLWVFAVLALKVKVIRRPAVLLDDMRPLPGRSGLAAASMSGMAVGLVLLPYAPGLALFLTLASLFAHLILALILINVLAREPEGKTVNPGWHLSYVGFIVAVPVLVASGWDGLARVIFALTFLAACLIWFLSVVQLIRRIPPAPLRPMLAIHLAPASLLALSAGLLGFETLALGLIALALAILLGLLASARWMLAAGFTPLWGALTFPLASCASALLAFGGNFATLGLALTVAALGVILPIAWFTLKLWPGNRLAQKTNAAEA